MSAPMTPEQIEALIEEVEGHAICFRGHPDIQDQTIRLIGTSETTTLHEVLSDIFASSDQVREALRWGLAEHEARVAAEAAQALVVERAAEIVDDPGDEVATHALGQRLCCNGRECGCMGADVGSYLQWLIRALAPASGVEALAALRAERDEAKRLMQARHREMLAADDLMRKHQRRAEAAEARLAERDAQLAALREANRCLRDDLAEANRKLGGGCEANDGGDHLVITQGNYHFCGKCGESLKGTRFCHMPRAALAKIEGSKA